MMLAATPRPGPMSSRLLPRTLWTLGALPGPRRYLRDAPLSRLKFDLASIATRDSTLKRSPLRYKTANQTLLCRALLCQKPPRVYGEPSPNISQDDTSRISPHGKGIRIHKPKVSFLDLEDSSFDEFELKVPATESSSGFEFVKVEGRDIVRELEYRANVRVMDPEGFPVGRFVRMQTLLLLPSGGAATSKPVDSELEAKAKQNDAEALVSSTLKDDGFTGREIHSFGKPPTMADPSNSSVAFVLESITEPSQRMYIGHLSTEDLLEAAASCTWASEVKSLDAAEEHVATLRKELDALEMQEYHLNEAALSSCRRKWWGMGGYLAVQNVVLAYGVWGVYSWDVMEPITYFIGSSVTIWGALYFALLRRENTYDTLFSNMLRRQKKAVYRRADYDPRKLDALRKAYRRALQHRDQARICEDPSLATKMFSSSS